MVSFNYEQGHEWHEGALNYGIRLPHVAGRLLLHPSWGANGQGGTVWEGSGTVGHALAHLFRKFATVCLEEVWLSTKVEGVSYVDDWLLFDCNPQALCKAVDFIRTLGITINEGNSVFIPTHKLVYMGFKIDTCQLTTRLSHLRTIVYFGTGGGKGPWRT